MRGKFPTGPKDPVGIENGIDFAVFFYRLIARIDSAFQYWKAYQAVGDGLMAREGSSCSCSTDR
jgi:hypothetical protein